MTGHREGEGGTSGASSPGGTRQGTEPGAQTHSLSSTLHPSRCLQSCAYGPHPKPATAHRSFGYQGQIQTGAGNIHMLGTGWDGVAAPGCCQTQQYKGVLSVKRGRTGELGYGTGVPRGSPLCSDQRQHFSLPRRPPLLPKRSGAAAPRQGLHRRGGTGAVMHGQSICCGGQKGFLRCRGASAEVPRFCLQRSLTSRGRWVRGGGTEIRERSQRHGCTHLALSTAGCLGHPTKHKGSRKQGSASPFGLTFV